MHTLKNKKQTAGFTLIEMMIAMTLGLILMAGLLGILQSNKRGAMFTKEQSLVQEDGRFAINYVKQFFHVAGFDDLFKPLVSGNQSGASTLIFDGVKKSGDGAAGTSDKLVLEYEVPPALLIEGTFRTCNGYEPEAGVMKIMEEFYVEGEVFKCQSYNATKATPVKVNDAAELAGGVLDFQVVYGMNLSKDLVSEPDKFTYLNATQVIGKNWGQRGIEDRIMGIKYALLIQADSNVDTGSSTQNSVYYVLDHKIEHSGKVPNLYASAFKFRNGG